MDSDAEQWTAQNNGQVPVEVVVDSVRVLGRSFSLHSIPFHLCLIDDSCDRSASI